jgi:hypothetical protein
MFAQRLFSDTSRNAIIQARIVLPFVQLLDATALEQKQKEIFLESLLMLARKLLSVWTHLERFQKRQKELEPNCPILDTDSASSSFELAYDQELFIEFDEFLVQYKSSLDHLAKVPTSLLGKARWNPRSFGDKGEKLVRMLKSAIPKTERHLIPAFQKLIFEKHKADLDTIIEARDRINHYVEGGLDYRNFFVFGTKQRGVITLRLPMWSADQPIADFMDVSFGNLIQFCESFIGFFVGIFQKAGLVFRYIPVTPQSTENPWSVITESEMKEQLRNVKPDWEFLRADAGK